MNLVQAKCPNCGAIVDVDQDKDAAICEYCNTPFVVEKAINNFNTVINNYNAKQDNQFSMLIANAKARKETYIYAPITIAIAVLIIIFAVLAILLSTGIIT